MDKKFVSNKIGRFSTLGKSLVKATGHLALDKAKGSLEKFQERKDKIEELGHKAKAAREIVRSMGELKGALMKLGQMISITEDLVLPPEIAALFAELQKNAPSMRDEDLNKAFIEGLGAKPEELFSSFERSPMAAASIGQVHRAVLKTGEEVAIKVQYPKIVSAIKNDFDNLENLKKLVTILFPKAPNIDNYVMELKRSLLEECDYEKELEHLQFFKEKCSTRFPEVTIPSVYPEFSCKTILTMELVSGDDYHETKNYSQEARDFLGQLVYDFHNFCFYELKCVHTDPQYGNFMFSPQGMTLLDFGSIRRFGYDFVSLYRQLLESTETRDLTLYRQVLLDFGFFDDSDEDELFEKHLKMVTDLYDPYNKPGKHGIPKTNPIDQIKTFAEHIDLKGRQAPREEFLLLDRAHLGMYTKIKGWECQIDWVTSKLLGWEALDEDKAKDDFEGEGSGLQKNP
jgi:aarF domain-containing kinase